jgi:hypothetical protein
MTLQILAPCIRNGSSRRIRRISKDPKDLDHYLSLRSVGAGRTPTNDRRGEFPHVTEKGMT